MPSGRGGPAQSMQNGIVPKPDQNSILETIVTEEGGAEMLVYV